MPDAHEIQLVDRAVREMHEHGFDARQIDAVQRLADLFRPYDGDPAEEAQSRVFLTAAQCRNCDHRIEGFARGAEIERLSRAAIRRCICPRCFCTEMMVVQGEAG